MLASQWARSASVTVNRHFGSAAGCSCAVSSIYFSNSKINFTLSKIDFTATLFWPFSLVLCLFPGHNQSAPSHSSSRSQPTTPFVCVSFSCNTKQDTGNYYIHTNIIEFAFCSIYFQNEGKIFAIYCDINKKSITPAANHQCKLWNVR